MADVTATVALRRSPDFTLEVDVTCPVGITCVMGPSGAGKSTLLAILAGLVAPDRGRVVVGGDVWHDSDTRVDVPVHRRRLAYVSQGLALFPHMTALANVTYGMTGVPRAEREGRAIALLDRVGVKHLARRRPRTFSGGEAQRVALARALARSPHLMLFDEPFSALDRDLRAQLTSLVRELVVEANVPLVHVTHSVNEARQLADQVIRIEKGKVVARGTAAETLADIAALE